MSAPLLDQVAGGCWEVAALHMQCLMSCHFTFRLNTRHLAGRLKTLTSFGGYTNNTYEEDPVRHL